MDVVAITGPTGSGKTQTSLCLAEKLGAEIVSCDSMQVYCYMDIGTDKLPLRQRLNPLHHMIDVVMPDEDYSVARYQREARSCIDGIFSRGNKVIVCGGTPLYLNALMCDIYIPPQNATGDLRRELAEKERERPGYLINRLKQIDPDALGLIDPANTRRLIRAIELFELSGVTYSELHRRWSSRKVIYDGKIICLYREREEVYQSIEQRVDKMFSSGLVEETEFLLENFRLSRTARQALGYKEVIDYLEGKITVEEAKELIKKRTRNYARRQMSWFRNDPNIEMLDVSGLEPEEACEKIINRLTPAM